MSSLWICLVALGTACLIPDRVRAASLDSSSFQKLSVGEKVEAVRNVVSLLSVKAALLAARSGKEAAIQGAEEAGEAQIRYREEESNLEGTFLKAIDCQLGLEPTGVCETERLSGLAGKDAPSGTPSETLSPATVPTTAFGEATRPAPGLESALICEAQVQTGPVGEGVAAETLSETPSPATGLPVASTEATGPAPGQSGNDSRGSRGVSLDLKASWTVSGLQSAGENFLNDTELLSYLGRKAGAAARDFFKAAAGGRLLEPTSKIAAEEFDEEKLGEVVRLAGKVLGSLHLNLTPTNLTLEAETRAGAGRRLTSKEEEGLVEGHKACKYKSLKVNKCEGGADFNTCPEFKSKTCSQLKGKCKVDHQGKCNSGAKRKCGKHFSSASEYSSDVDQPTRITSAALPFYPPYPMVLQPQMVSLSAHTPGVPIIYDVSHLGAATANTAGAAAAPLYQDGVLLFPIAHGTDGGLYQLNGSGINQGAGLSTANGVSESAYLLSDTGSLPAWRSSEFLPRLPTSSRHSIIQEIPPLILGPIAALNAQVQQNPLLSPLYRSALWRYLFDADNTMHYEELQNFNMTRADLF